MSLDKFIKGKPIKKKKKKEKSQTPLSDNSISEKQPKLDIIEGKKSSLDDAQKESSNIEFSSEKISILDKKTDQNKQNTLHDQNNKIFIEELRSKSNFEMFQVILELVHSSPSYSRNKNIIAQLYQDKKDQLNPEILAEQLGVSYNEIIVIIAEVKQDFV